MSKYKNQKCTVNDIEFDSKKEARRYGELLLMERAGTITDLQRQVTFELIPKQKDPDGGVCTSRKVHSRLCILRQGMHADGRGGCEGYANSCIYLEKETDVVDSWYQDTGSVREWRKNDR